MGDRSTIEWTDATWNPTTGCDQVSTGCDRCYALTMAKRLKAMRNPRYQADGDPRTSGPGFGLTLHDDVLELPLRWRKPRRVFVNSMSDLFHPRVPGEFIVAVFAVMALAEQHTFQVLTKRPKRVRALLGDTAGHRLADGREFVFRQAVKQRVWAMTCDRGEADSPTRYMGFDAWFEGNWPLHNVWLGTSIESQRYADERIPDLLATPAAVRFLSCEPLLGPVDLASWLVDLPEDQDGAPYPGNGLGWVIVGGESGRAARPMHPDWVRTLRDQCTTADVAFFFKQWGAWWPVPVEPMRDQERYGLHRMRVLHISGDLEPNLGGRALDYDAIVINLGKHAAGRDLDGRTWDELPEVVTADV